MHRLSFPLIASLCLLALPPSAAAEPFKIPPNEAAPAHMEKGSDPGDFVRKCPPGFNDTPAMPAHYGQSTILGMPLDEGVRARPTDLRDQFQRLRRCGTSRHYWDRGRSHARPGNGTALHAGVRTRNKLMRRMPFAAAARRGRRFRRQCIRAGAGSRSGFAHHPQRGFQQHLGRTQYARDVRRRRNRDARARDDHRFAGRATGRDQQC